ncbi:MAG: hypothetical protein ABW104_18215, partial [Candidatus Thiodiazotropha sp. 6PLUC2]
GAQEAILGARNCLTTKLPPNKERKIIDTTDGGAWPHPTAAPINLMINVCFPLGFLELMEQQ